MYGSAFTRTSVPIPQIEETEMLDRVDYNDIVRMLQTIAEKIKAKRDCLSKLDAATGDGDHGTAMFKVAEAITATIQKDQSKDIRTLWKDISWAVMSTDAGSTSPLYGSFFAGMSDGVGANSTLGCSEFASMLVSGAAKLRRNTRAQIGNKTMIDSLVPAIDAIKSASEIAKTFSDTLEAGADAAVKGAEATRNMKAIFGRAM